MAEYIEREVLIDKTSDVWMNGSRYRVVFFDDVILAPAADVAQVTHGMMKKSGEFTVERYQYKIVEEKCSACGHYSIRFKHKSESNFCPNCGAKMDEVMANG